MSPPTAGPESGNYLSRLSVLLAGALRQLVRSPSHSRRAAAARRSARHVLQFTAVIAIAIIVLMYAVDVYEISLMPPRGTPSLWPVRILTDFGKDTYVLCALGGLMIAAALIAPAQRGLAQARWLRFGTHLQFLFLAVLLSVLVGDVLKWVVGRGRPFVGGHANAFNFSHFAGSEAYASLPSGHAITAFALAFAVSALWPRVWIAMALYAIMIAATRLVLLAHHPSDVVAGALVGIVGAMAVRYWFAARRLGFAIRSDGGIVALTGPLTRRLKGVARDASAP